MTKSERILLAAAQSEKAADSAQGCKIDANDPLLPLAKWRVSLPKSAVIVSCNATT